MEQLPDLIVGAGLTGLVAAYTLHTAHRSVTVLDKGRGVGGRMATRRIDEGVFDHGAQFFTVRDAAFENLVQSWIDAGVAREWCRGFYNETAGVAGNGHPRYAGHPGMTAIAKHLAQDLNVRCGERVVLIEELDEMWQVRLESGERLLATKLLLTPPIPQALALLDAGKVAIPAGLRQALLAVTYEPCLAVLAILDQPSAIPTPGAVQTATEPLAWIADNQQKGISPRAVSLTLQAGPGFSEAYWDTDDTEIAQVLLDAASGWLGEAQATHVAVKRWRYSRPCGLFSSPTVIVQQQPLLLLAGDAFGGPRLEGAALSGLAAADTILRLSS